MFYPGSFATRHGAWIHLLSLPWLALLAWLTSVAWFLTDDAFISFRYVRNLLEGHGLVFNPGEYVEGYTNFLWILELAALWGLFGLRPEQAAPWLSIAYTGGTLAALWWWLARSPRAMTGASWPGWPWGCYAVAPPSRCGPRAAGWKPAVHLLHRRSRRLPGGAWEQSLGPAGGLVEPGGRRLDEARGADASPLAASAGSPSSALSLIAS